MTKFSLKSRFSTATIAIAAATVGLAEPAFAQGQPPGDPAAQGGQGDQAIVVTGSRIRRDPLDQDNPVVFVDREFIDRTGLTSVAEVLQRLPSAGGALNSRFNNSGNFGNPPDGGGVGAGASEVDLRYLGSKRTLVLLDGLRYVNGASASGVPGSTDLNTIPEGMIERVEVLQSGASSIYGSDAIAGVVNIITRRDQEGFLGSAQLGVFDEGDGFTQNYQLSWGSGNMDSGTSIVVGASYTKQEDVSSISREISQFPTPGTDACDATCSSGTPNGRFIVLGQDLTLIAPVIGRTPTLADFRPFAGAPDRFNFAPFNLIQIPLERYGAFVNVSQELGEDIEFNAARRSTTSAIRATRRRRCRCSSAPTPATAICSTPSSSTPPIRSIRSATLGPGTYNFIGRRVVENGPRRYDQEVDTFYVAGTLDGDVSDARLRLVLGRQPALGQERGRADGPRQYQRGQPRPCPGPGRELHRALRAVQHLRRLAARSPSRCSIMSPSPRSTAASRSCGTSRRRSAAACSTCPAGRPDSRSASSIATRPAASTPTRSSPPAWARTFRRSRPAAAIMSTRSSPNCGCRCLPIRTSSTASS